jgi:exodeoxyribonuclease-3
LARVAPDVLAIQETKVQDDLFPAGPFREAGYHIVFRGQKAQAGVALATRTAPEEVAFGLGDSDEPDEPRLVRARVRGISIVNTYVPQGRAVDSPHFAYKLAWIGRLRGLLERAYAPDRPLIWLGDLNVAPEEIDVYDPKRLAKEVDFHPEARAALAHAMAWGLTDVVRQLHPGEEGLYTYWDYRVPGALERGMGWRVDHILVTAPLAARATCAWVDLDARRVERPSDHTFLVVEFALGG